MKLEISNGRKIWKFTNMWKLNKILLNNQQIKEEITREMKKYFEINENKSVRYQNLQDAAIVL